MWNILFGYAYASTFNSARERVSALKVDCLYCQTAGTATTMVLAHANQHFCKQFLGMTCGQSRLETIQYWQPSQTTLFRKFKSLIVWMRVVLCQLFSVFLQACVIYQHRHRHSVQTIEQFYFALGQLYVSIGEKNLSLLPVQRKLQFHGNGAYQSLTSICSSQDLA